MGEKWICSCGTENNGNFCIRCGSPRPVAVSLENVEEQTHIESRAHREAQVPHAPRTEMVSQPEDEVQQAPPTQAEEPLYQAPPQQPVQEQPAEEQPQEPLDQAPQQPAEEVQQAEELLYQAPPEQPVQEQPAEEQPQEPLDQAPPQQQQPYMGGQPQAPQYGQQQPYMQGQQQPPQYGQQQPYMQGQQQPPQYRQQQPYMQGQQQPPQYRQQQPYMGGQPMPQTAAVPVQQKSKKKLFMIIGIAGGAVVLIAAALLLYFLVFAKDYKTNQYTETEQLQVPEGFDLFVDEQRDISFLYPKFLAKDRLEDGDYIYGDQKAEMPYICINRYNGKESPKNYFKDYEAANPEFSFSSINEVEVEDKTLYMVEAPLTDFDGDIQQYIEIYDAYYITYTAVGYHAEQPNTELYYAVQSLRPSANAYAAPAKPDPVNYSNSKGNFSVVVPGDYTMDERGSGVYAYNDASELLAFYFNNDSVGSIIYDSDDFAARSAQVDNYVARILSVQEVDFSEGTEETINGTKFNCYPMTAVLADGSNTTGKLCVADADPFGCYIVSYFLEDNADEDDEASCEEFLHSIKIDGSPDIDNYQVMDVSDKELGKIAVKSELVGSMGLDDNVLVISNPDDTGRVLLAIMSGPEVKDAADKLAATIEKKYDVKIDVKETELPDEGRYVFDGYEMNYTDDGTDYSSKIIGVTDTAGNVYCMYYNVDSRVADWADEVCENIIWSWKLD